MPDWIWLMDIALKKAEEAYKLNEVPVGAVITDFQGKILAESQNAKEANLDATAHAEILAIRKASKELSNWRLQNCIAYITLEPCPMCFSALIQSRISTIVFGAYDLKGGALSLGYKFNLDKRMNHKVNIVGGIKSFESGRLLSSFFKQKRESYKSIKKPAQDL